MDFAHALLSMSGHLSAEGIYQPHETVVLHRIRRIHVATGHTQRVDISSISLTQNELHLLPSLSLLIIYNYILSLVD